MQDAPPQHYTEAVAGFMALLIGAFTAWAKRLIKSLELVPLLQEKVEKVEEEMASHLKDVAVEKERYIKDVAEIKANQALYKEGQQRIIDSIDGLSKTIASFHRDLTERIDNVVSRGL